MKEEKDLNSKVKKMEDPKNSTRITMTLKDIEIELGVSRKVATAWAQQYLHYKRIGRQYIFSRKEFTEVIEAQTDIIYELRY